MRANRSDATRRWFPVAIAAFFVSPAIAQNIEHIKEIFAPDTLDSDHFGRSVAYNGVECFIGAPERAEGGIFAAGAGYFFGQNLGGPDNWGFAVKRNEIVPGSADRFGYSVGMTGSHAVAGVWGDDDNGQNAGAAYLYERNLGGIGAWGLRKKLLASDGAMSDHFGWSVDMHDGVAIVGARLKNSSQGAAYIFEENFGGTDNWGQSKKLTSPAANNSFFGESVAIDNQFAVVGAFKDPTLGDSAGAVYVYEKFPSGAPEGPAHRTSTWKFFKMLTAPDGGANDLFGSAVCVHNNYVVVGAPTHQDGTGVFGAVYIFHRNQGGAGNFGLVQKLENPDTDILGDDFGRSVDMDGELLSVGVPQDGAIGASPGALYVYVRDLGGPDNWGVLAKVTSPSPDHSDLVGHDVDIVGDTIVAGALGEDVGVFNFAGAAHVYRVNSVCPEDLNGDGVVDTADLGILIGAFGGSGLGDLNLDGVIDTADLGALIGGYGATDCAYAP